MYNNNSGYGYNQGYNNPPQRQQSQYGYQQGPPPSGYPPPNRGYSYQAGPPPPPPGADPQLWQWFTAVDTDKSGAITVTELQAALVNGE